MNELIRSLREAGMHSSIAEALELAPKIVGCNGLPTVDEKRLLEKYRAAGMKALVAQTDLDLRMRYSHYLNVELRCWKVFPYHTNFRTSFERTVEEHTWRGSRQHQETVPLSVVPIEFYEREVPEPIMDILLATKAQFNSHYILVPGVVRYSLESDPVLLGSYASIRDNKRNWFAVLGVWGNDWFELNLSPTTNLEEFL